MAMDNNPSTRPDANTLPVRVTQEGLKSIMPFATAAHLENFCEPLNATLNKYGINTPPRAAAFLAQIAHESGELRYTQEIADGKAYEDRLDLGNTEPGDGPRFKGRGLIQITGRTNYAALSKYTGVDFIAKPELLEGAIYATESAGWFWAVLRQLNRYADMGDMVISKYPSGKVVTGFTTITLRINGGFNGEAQREEYYTRAKKLFGI